VHVKNVPTSMQKPVPKNSIFDVTFMPQNSPDQHSGLYNTILKVLQPSHPASLTIDPSSEKLNYDLRRRMCRDLP